MLNSKPRTDIFSLKKVKFLNRTVRIALQNQNGPCSLLALFNLLILRNDIQVSNDHGSISLDTVVSILADFLLSKNSTSPSAQMQNHSENQNMQRLLEDCISILPSLKDGLDVNVKFKKPTDFEYSANMTIFDLTNAELFHGWLPDPQDSETYSVLSELSYNQVVEKLVSTPVTTPTQPQKNENNLQTTQQTQQQTQNANPFNPFNEPMQSTNPFAYPDPEELKQIQNQQTQIQNQQTQPPTEKEESKEIKLLRNFLKNTASQLTFYGLTELHRVVKERQLCVLFRNNHFSTMFKLNGHLYTLATDSGFIDESNLVWEFLNTADNDTVYCDSDFKLYVPTVPKTSGFSFSTFFPGVTQFIDANALKTREQMMNMNPPAHTYNQAVKNSKNSNSIVNPNGGGSPFLTPQPVATLTSFQYSQPPTQTQPQQQQQQQQQPATQIQTPNLVLVPIPNQEPIILPQIQQQQQPTQTQQQKAEALYVPLGELKLTESNKNVNNQIPQQPQPTIASLPSQSTNTNNNNNQSNSNSNRSSERQFHSDYEMALHLQQEDERKYAEERDREFAMKLQQEENNPGNRGLSASQPIPVGHQNKNKHNKNGSKHNNGNKNNKHKQQEQPHQQIPLQHQNTQTQQQRKQSQQSDYDDDSDGEGSPKKEDKNCNVM